MNIEVIEYCNSTLIIEIDPLVPASELVGEVYEFVRTANSELNPIEAADVANSLLWGPDGALA